MTRMVASARGDSTTASVTESVGGVSITMWSYMPRNSAIRSRRLEDASSSAGFGGGVPAGRMKRLGKIGDTVMVCCMVALPVNTLLRPLRGPMPSVL